jgi:hypothetical protein
MTWRELSDFLHLQRRPVAPRPISEFARIVLVKLPEINL